LERGASKPRPFAQRTERKPGGFAKMQSPGEGRLMKFCGAAAPRHRRSAPVKGGSGGPNPSKIDQGANEPEGEIWATGRILPRQTPAFPWTVKPGGAVNGGRSPFILTVDWLGWGCYLPGKLELMKESLY